MHTRFGMAVVAAASAMLLSGCYHQVVATGLPASSTKVEKPWTSTWIFGLVEAKPIDVRQPCASGVAFVESKFTVPNWFGSVFTLGIWTPRHVSVTCASAGRASLDPGTPTIRIAGASTSLAQAARLASERGGRVALVWDPTITSAEDTP